MIKFPTNHLDGPDYSAFCNKIVEENDFELDVEIKDLLNKFVPNNAVPWRSAIHSVNSQNVKIWMQITELLLKKLSLSKVTADNFIFEKTINKSFQIVITYDKKHFKTQIRAGTIDFHNAWDRFFLLNTVTGDKIRINIMFDISLYWDHFFYTKQDPEIVCKKFYLYLKAYFYNIDEYIKIMKPYFDNLADKVGYEK